MDTFAVEQEGSLLSKGNEVIVPASGETAEDIADASSVRRSGIFFGGDLNVVAPVSKLDPDYTALAITYSKPHHDLAKRAQGKSVVHVHGNDIAEVEVSYPSESEQKRYLRSFLISIPSSPFASTSMGSAPPKDPMITEIARCLEVNPSSLKSDWGSDTNDAIHMLFELEEAFCLEPIKVGETVMLALPEDLGSEDQEALAKALRHWYRNNRNLKDDELTRDEYVAWKDSFKA